MEGELLPPDDELDTPPPISFARPYLENFSYINPDTYDFTHCWTATHRDGPYNVDDVVAAILCTGGNFGKMSILLQRNRQRIKDFVMSHRDVMNVYNDVLESNLDDIQNGAMIDALRGDGPMSRFFLTTLGKDRGFTQRVEQTGSTAPLPSELPKDPQDAAKVYQQLMAGNGAK